MSQNKLQTGFTIVEITLAMTFIATLLIAVLTVSMQMFSLYNKGLTIKDVNTVARTTVRDIQVSVAQSSSAIKLVEPTPGAAVQTTLEQASSEGLHYYNSPATDGVSSGGGRLCTGSFTYIWNYQKAFSAYSPSPTGEFENVQFYEQSGKFTPIRFVKIQDDARELCEYVDTGDVRQQNAGKRLPDRFVDKIQPVFGEGDRNLAVYDLQVTSPESLVFSTSTQEEGANTDVNTSFYSTFYTFSMTIGSSLFPDEITDNACKPPADSKDIHAEYCAINEIDFVARTGQY
jgi:hypothetical protein